MKPALQHQQPSEKKIVLSGCVRRVIEFLMAIKSHPNSMGCASINLTEYTQFRHEEFCYVFISMGTLSSFSGATNRILQVSHALVLFAGDSHNFNRIVLSLQTNIPYGVVPESWTLSSYEAAMGLSGSISALFRSNDSSINKYQDYQMLERSTIAAEIARDKFIAAEIASDKLIRDEEKQKYASIASQYKEFNDRVINRKLLIDDLHRELVVALQSCSSKAKDILISFPLCTERQIQQFCRFLKDFRDKGVNDTNSLHRYGICLDKMDCFRLNSFSDATRSTVISVLAGKTAIHNTYDQVLDQFATSFSPYRDSVATIQKFLRPRVMHRAIKRSYTPGQAFLLSSCQPTDEQILAFLKGPKLTLHGHVYHPDYSSQNSYKERVIDNIDAYYKDKLAHRYWADSSRRCFDSVLAFETLKRAANDDELLAFIDKVKKAVFESIRLQPSRILPAKMVESGANLSGQGHHRTYLDLANAVRSIKSLFLGNFAKLLTDLLTIWAASLFNQMFYSVFENDINPLKIKGRFVNPPFIRLIQSRIF